MAVTRLAINRVEGTGILSSRSLSLPPNTTPLTAKVVTQSASSQKKALFRKEAQRFFGTPMYFWNAGLGLILLLAAGVASLILRDKLLVYLGMAGESIPLLPMAAAVICFCLCTCPIAAPSVSLEGKYLWILREAPMSDHTLRSIS